MNGNTHLTGKDGQREVVVLMTFVKKAPWLIAFFHPDEDNDQPRVGTHWRLDQHTPEEVESLMCDEARKLRDEGLTTTRSKSFTGGVFTAWAFLTHVAMKGLFGTFVLGILDLIT